MSDHPQAHVEHTIQQQQPQPQLKSSSPLSQGVELAPSTQTLDESTSVLSPVPMSDEVTVVCDTATMDSASTTTTTTTTTTENTQVEADQAPQATFQPDDLVCLADAPSLASATQPLTSELILSLSTTQASPGTPQTTNLPQVDPLPTPQQTPLHASTLPTTAPLSSTMRAPILRASMGKRSLARLDEDDTGDASKRQRANNQQSILNLTQTSLTPATSTITSTTTTTTASQLVIPQTAPMASTTATTTTTTNTVATAPTVSNSHNSATKILVQQYKELSKNPPVGISVDIEQGNLHRWKVIMFGPPGTPYEGGIFPCSMTFPTDYPVHPPTFSFTPNFPHPNVFADGKVCISILHDANDSNYEHEPQSERWKPILGVEAILLSVMSLLSEPNTNSPANVEMSKLFRDDQREYRKRIILAVRRSQEQALSE